MARSRKAEMSPTNEAMIEEGGAVATEEAPKPRSGPKSKREAENELNSLQTPKAGLSEEEQAEMWPELDTADPKQKAVLSAARKLNRKKGERDALLTTSKEEVDACSQKLIGLMHEAGIKKFKFQGIEAEILETTEKVKVKVGDEDDDAGDDE